MSLVENLRIKHGSLEIDIPQWEILDQGVTILWGPSGAGKTSVIRALLGLDIAPSMKWIFKGVDLAQLFPPARRIGVVFQTLDLFPHMTAKDNIMFAAKARGLDPAAAQKRLKQYSSSLQLDSLLGRSASVLSGGEKQRVALVRALISEPRLLLLDEPFSALDQDLRSESRRLLAEVIGISQIPTLLVTHDEQDVISLADKKSSIRAGRIVDEVFF